MKKFLAVCAFLWTFSVAAAWAQNSVGFRIVDIGDGDKSVTAAVWYPTEAKATEYRYGGSDVKGMVAVDAAPSSAGGPYPFLVFSHGYGGGGIGNAFFAEALAARGWIIAAPDHSDKDQAVRSRTGVREIDAAEFLRNARKISDAGLNFDHKAFAYRPDEFKRVLDGLIASPTFGALIDKEKIAVGGHSLGGYTALVLCGTIPERRDDRVKAILIFSSGVGSSVFKDEQLASVKIPAMYLYGEKEADDRRAEVTMKEHAGRLFKNLAGPKYLLEVKGANHFSFNDNYSRRKGKWAELLGGTGEQFDLIRRYGIAFLERHVLGKASDQLEKDDPALIEYRRPPTEK